MARDWESTFSDWTGRASDAEQSRYEWTRGQIEDALRGNPRLSAYSFEVYVKGSYPNFTNVVRDVAVLRLAPPPGDVALVPVADVGARKRAKSQLI
jgi:hypothetical protein